MGKLSAIEKTLKKGENVEIPDDVPEQFREFGPTPTPGAYVFQLPETLEGWEPVELEQRDNEGKAIIDPKTKKPKMMQRLEHRFEEDSQLVIVRSPGGKFDAEKFRTRVSTVERFRDKEKTKKVSDLYYLLHEAFGETPTSKWELVDWGKALDKHAGEKFGADVEWSTYCNSDKPAYVEISEGEGDGAVTRVVKSGENGVEEIKGCGASMYQKDIKALATTDGDGNLVWPESFKCRSCEVAVLRPFPRLARFRKAE